MFIIDMLKNFDYKLINDTKKNLKNEVSILLNNIRLKTI